MPTTTTPAGTLMLDLPDQASATAYDHVMLNWNPQGHDPVVLFGKPHFDIHFDMVDMASIPGRRSRGPELRGRGRPPAGAAVRPAGVRPPAGRDGRPAGGARHGRPPRRLHRCPAWASTSSTPPTAAWSPAPTTSPRSSSTGPGTAGTRSPSRW
ncbi:hypothetical protein [Pseudonocardia yuanmonensis]|uniref:hypothetical protein n=1 Tax=Pseudonocardia yuanmonensis TaxID=1095914 RepID=UPI003CD0B498